MSEERHARLAGDPRPAPSITWRGEGLRDVEAETLVVFVALGEEPDGAGRELLAALEFAAFDEIPGVRELSPGPGDSWRMPALGRLAARELLLVWHDDDPDARQGLFESALVAGRLSATRSPVAVALPAHGGALDAVLEGVLYGRCRFAPDPASPDGAAASGELLLIDGEGEPPGLARAAERAAVIAGTLSRTRDLVDAPPNVLTPTSFAAIARDVAAGVGAQARVWTVDELREGRFAGLLEVGRASVHPPALVELTYEGAGAGAPTVAIVGKGITFDSGTYDLKPVDESVIMKRDMGGAGAVLGAFEAAVRLRLPVNLVALLAIAENVLAGDALRPGDVIVHRNGVTTEITNPDAEGRLVLADALAYAAERRPAAIVEVSTLVGPSLGPDLWGLLTSDDALAEELLEAGRVASDPGWREPLWRRYRRYITTPVADQRNSTQSMRYPIAVISSALFLDRFVPEDIPWAHLDVAVTAMREGGTATAAWPAGATGSPVRALVAWLAGRAGTT